MEKDKEKDKVQWVRYGTKFQKFYKENLKNIYKN